MPDRAAENDSPQGRLSAERLDLILRDLDTPATLPAVAARLVAMVGGNGRDPKQDADDFIELVRLDISLTTKLLSLADGARTPAEAVKQIGFEAARSALLSVGVFQDPGSSPECGGLDREGFWVHCLAVATTAEMLADRTHPRTDAGEAFVCGLLHDLGKLVLAESLPKSYSRALGDAKTDNGDLTEIERSFIGVDHCVAGRRAAETWRLPPRLREVIWFHHQAPEAVPRSISGRRLTIIVSLADAIVRRQRFGFSGNHAFARTVEQLADQVGLDETALNKVIAELPGRIEAGSRLLGLHQVSSESLYREALAGANAELGRLNEKLRLRAEALDAQARAFRFLGDFTAHLRPDAAVADILLRVAEVLSAADDHTPGINRPAVAYSAGEGGQSVLAVRFDGGAHPAWRSLPRNADFDETVVSPEPSAVAEAARALLDNPSDLGEWVDLSAYAHHPLICAGRWIGGVFLPAKEPPQADEKRQAASSALSGALALAMSIAQGRSGAVVLSEELAGASQVLAATQEALAESKTLAAIGEIATGAAHELNNPLAVISGRAQLMRKQAANKHDRETWELIADEAQKISNIITEMMELACPPAPQVHPVGASDLLRDAVEAFSSSEHPQAASARIDIEVPNDTPDLLVDRAQMCAVLEELIANAATAGGSEVHIRLAGGVDESAETVLLTVQDNGPGMDARTMERAFAPFFSAQRAGRRRGLGLSRAKRHVENNGGKLWIRTDPGAGTTVHLRLPAAGGSPKR